MISKHLIVGFQNGRQLKKMAPRCFLGQIPRFTGTENGRHMEDLRWTSRYSAHWNTLNGFQCISIGFLKFRLTTFSLYSISLERINVVKQGTTVQATPLTSLRDDSFRRAFRLELSRVVPHSWKFLLHLTCVSSMGGHRMIQNVSNLQGATLWQLNLPHLVIIAYYSELQADPRGRVTSLSQQVGRSFWRD